MEAYVEAEVIAAVFNLATAKVTPSAYVYYEKEAYENGVVAAGYKVDVSGSYGFELWGYTLLKEKKLGTKTVFHDEKILWRSSSTMYDEDEEIFDDDYSMPKPLVHKEDATKVYTIRKKSGEDMFANRMFRAIEGMKHRIRADGLAQG